MIFSVLVLWASLKNMPGHGGDRIAELAEHWASIPKVVDSIPRQGKILRQ